jgi:hypothetical protein
MLATTTTASIVRSSSRLTTGCSCAFFIVQLIPWCQGRTASWGLGMQVLPRYWSASAKWLIAFIYLRAPASMMF